MCTRLDEIIEASKNIHIEQMVACKSTTTTMTDLGLGHSKFRDFKQGYFVLGLQINDANDYSRVVLRGGAYYGHA